MYASVGREEERPCWRWRPKDVAMSPSRADGIPLALERGMRTACVSYIVQMANKLVGDGISRAPITTACVLMNRFFGRQSMGAHDRHIIAAACLYLATKIEEMHKKVKHFVSVAYCCQHDLDVLPFDIGSPQFLAYRDQLLDAERRVLYTLEMDMAVDHPYPLVVETIKRWRDTKFEVRGEKPLELAMMAKAASEIAFDCMTTELALLFTAKEIAIGALWVAWHTIPLPSRFHLDETDFHTLLEQPMLHTVVSHYVDMTIWHLDVEAKYRTSGEFKVSGFEGRTTPLSSPMTPYSSLLSQPSPIVPPMTRTPSMGPVGSFTAVGAGIAMMPFALEPASAEKAT